MGNQANSREERAYFLAETTYGVAVSPAAATDAIEFTQFSLNNNNQVIVRRDKTGSRGMRPGARGRDTASWSIDGSLTPNPAAGVAPPMDALLLAAFGAKTIVASTSVTYTLANAIKSMTAYSYRTPSTMAQRCAPGSVVSSFSASMGGDYLNASFSGESKYVIYSDLFSGLDTEHKAGLSGFPAEPGSQDYTDDGGLVLAFTGSCVIGGNTMISLRSATTRITTGNATRKDTFGKFTADGTEGAMRQAGCSFQLYDEDSAEVTAVRSAAETKTPVDIILTVGFATNARFEFTHKNVQLASMTLDDGSIRWSTTVPESNATETTPGANDEYKLKIF